MSPYRICTKGNCPNRFVKTTTSNDSLNVVCAQCKESFNVPLEHKEKMSGPQQGKTKSSNNARVLIFIAIVAAVAIAAWATNLQQLLPVPAASLPQYTQNFKGLYTQSGECSLPPGSEIIQILTLRAGKKQSRISIKKSGEERAFLPATFVVQDTTLVFGSNAFKIKATTVPNQFALINIKGERMTCSKFIQD
jgi:hypothetical protein